MQKEEHLLGISSIPYFHEFGTCASVKGNLFSKSSKSWNKKKITKPNRVLNKFPKAGSPFSDQWLVTLRHTHTNPGGAQDIRSAQPHPWCVPSDPRSMPSRLVKGGHKSGRGARQQPASFQLPFLLALARVLWLTPTPWNWELCSVTHTPSLWGAL